MQLFSKSSQNQEIVLAIAGKEIPVNRLADCGYFKKDITHSDQLFEINEFYVVLEDKEYTFSMADIDEDDLDLLIEAFGLYEPIEGDQRVEALQQIGYKCRVGHKLAPGAELYKYMIVHNSVPTFVKVVPNKFNINDLADCLDNVGDIVIPKTEAELYPSIIGAGLKPNEAWQMAFDLVDGVLIN